MGTKSLTNWEKPAEYTIFQTRSIPARHHRMGPDPSTIRNTIRH